MKLNIRLLYLYLFSFVGLLVTVIGLIRLVDLGIKVYLFHNADQYTYTRPIMPDEKSQISPETEQEMMKQQSEENKRQRQRTAAEALSMIIVGIPLYAYHWKLAQKEKR